MQLRRALIAAAVLAVSNGAWAATVEVAVAALQAHADIGTTTWDQQDNLRSLANYIVRVGRELLPADQVLKVELLDVDLAGSQIGLGPRTMRGGADWPRIKLRWTLQAPGQAARSGEEIVQDLNYTMHIRESGARSDPLYYEKRMLREWLKERFAAPPA